MKFKISKLDEFIIINHYPEPYYEGEEPEGDSMVIEENDLDDLIDALDSYVEKRGGN
ncbi:MAG: hypothetical protein KIY10_10020 [Thermoplasmata archaeon]|jgi:hypothetical protein|nr:hypothetical protein [Candidatus Sysuiplasma jiujiangense]